jgi:uncharacterized protein (TIGR03435 family)
MMSSALRLVAATLAAAAPLVAHLPAQDVPTPPRRGFDVASVKVNPSSAGRPGFQQGAGAVYIRSATALEIVAWSYDMFERDISGGPAWIRSTRFDVNARVEGPALKPSEVRPMVKALLVARFGLDAVIEKAEKLVYALRLANSDGRLGPYLKPAKEMCTRPDAFREGPPPSPVRVLTAGCGISMMISPEGALGLVNGKSATIAEFVYTLNRQAQFDSPIVDQTGLTGEFDFGYAPGMITRDAAGNNTPRTGFEALTAFDQLGLKLESTRAEVDVLVIRRIQPPIAN